MSAPWMATSDPSCFVDFEQVKNLVVILLTLNKLKKLTKKLPCEKLDVYASFFGHDLMSPALHPGFSDLWRSPPALSSTLTLGFFECLGIQFFNLLTCDLQDTMPCQRSPILIPREAEDFPRCDNHSKHVPLPTYLAWFQPIYYDSRFVFIHVKTTKILLVVKTLIKKHRAETKVISSHESKIKIIAPSKNAFQNMGEFFKIASSKDLFSNNELK